jgi:signal transduction histidine kinase
MAKIWPVPHPRRWGLRVRSALIVTVAVAAGMAAFTLALTAVLYHSLIGAANDAATARVDEITRQLKLDAPAELDHSALATDRRLTTAQIIAADNQVVQASTGAPTTPLTAVRPAPGQIVYDAAPADAEFGLRLTATTTDGLSGRYTVVVATNQEEIENTVKLVLGLAGIGTPFITVIAAGATYLLVGRSLRSVETIRGRVAAITSTDLTERVPVPQQRDEIAALAHTMNEMLARIEAGNNAQRRFVADASHELRSPLTSMSAALELGILRPDLFDTTLVETTLVPETERMRHLIDDLLLLAQSDERGLPHRTVDVDLDDIVAAEIGRKRSQSGPIEISSDLEPVRIRGDAGHISRAVRNLLDNAARYAAASVTVRLTQDGDSARIEIADDGPGIPPADRDRVFDRFLRLQHDRSRDTGGSGLGLAIVAEIVAAHHGSVHFTNTPSGGATAVITLPLDQ